MSKIKIMSIIIEYICLFAASLLGILIHLITKAEGIKSRNDAAGLRGNPFKELFQKDYISILKAVLLNGALLIFYAFAKSKWTEIDFMVGLLGFLFSGYTGSSFVLSLFSKVDKIQKENLNNVSILTPNKMEQFKWVMAIESLEDIGYYDGQNLHADALASASDGTLDGLEITYMNEPTFSKITMTRPDTTTYFAEPIRRPK